MIFSSILGPPKQLTASNDLDPEQFDRMEILRQLAVAGTHEKVSMDGAPEPTGLFPSLPARAVPIHHPL